MDSSSNSDRRYSADPLRNEKHGLFLILIMAVLGLLTIFVETMLVPALPGIAESLQVRSSDLAWVLTAYTLAGAVSIPIVGKMGEMWGRKRILLFIMAIYLVGLLGAAVSWDLLSLVLFRALQGVGMGAIPLLMGVAKDILPLHLVPTGIGLISAMIGVGSALGFVIGGLLISVIGWQGAFWVVVPIVLLMVVIMYRTIPDAQIRQPAKMDVAGAALMGVGLLTLLLALSRGSLWGWDSAISIGLVLGSMGSFIAFVIRERNCHEPIVRLDLLKNRNILVAYVSMLFIGAIMFMLYQTLPYFLGMPPEAGGFGIASHVIIGLFILPTAVMQLIFSPIGGKRGQRIGHGKILVFGLAIAAGGLLSISLLRWSEVGVLLGMAVFGIGIGLATVGNTNMLSSACSRENFGSAMAVDQMLLMIGMSAGPVIASVIIGGFADASTGYAYCWGIAALLALLAIVSIFWSKADLGIESVIPASHEEKA